MTTSAAPHRWSNRTLVREPDTRGARSLWRSLLAVAVALAPSIGYLVVQNDYLSVMYQLSRLRSERERLSQQEQNLRVERARLESLGAIEDWALHERGLVAPDPRKMLVLPGSPPPERERPLPGAIAPAAAPVVRAGVADPTWRRDARE